MRSPTLSLLLFLIVPSLLTACSETRYASGRNEIESAGWTWSYSKTDRFDIAYALSPPSPSPNLVVYIEGDGYAYARPDLPSIDPTPYNATAMKMALKSPSSFRTAWLGRPCQYARPDHFRGCKTAYWTEKRYAPEILESLQEALQSLKEETNTKRFILVGYSGGGTLAMWLALNRNDVEKVITVAANLDLEAWVRRDNLAPLKGSRDPGKEAERFSKIPQLHLTGEKDDVTGTDIVRSFVEKEGKDASVSLKEIKNYTHRCCWAEEWDRVAPDYLSSRPQK